MFFNNNLPYNSLKSKTIDLLKIEMISKTINSYRLNCKCLLIMDNLASKLISKYMSLSEVINLGVFSMESIYKKRKPYKNYGAIYLISSAESSIKLVLEDFKNEKKRLYKWCFLFIIDKITNQIIELLLNKKFIKRIKALKEVIMDYIPLDKNLFFFGLKGNFNSLYQLFSTEENKFINNISLSKICSICRVTNTFPNIIYFIHDTTCKNLAEKINKKLKKYFGKLGVKKNGILLLTSRKLDLVGPVQFDLNYGHLLMELYKNLEKSEKNKAKINLNGKEENIVFDHEDILYNKYKILSLYQIMTTINTDIEKFMKSDMAKLEKRNDLNSIEEMGTAMKNITEYKYLSPLYNKHLKIVEDINKKCLERNIMKIIDLQSTVISGANYKGKKKGASHISKRILENKNDFTKDDFVRLLCIIKYYNPESDIKSLIDIIETETVAINNNERQIINFFTQENAKINIEFLKSMDKYIVLHRNKHNYNTQEDQDNKNDKRYLCVKESKITTLIDMCCKNELPKEFFEYVETPENITFHKYQANIILENNINNVKDTEEDKNLQNLILFNVGGLSNFEVSSIDKANNIGQFNFNIIYGSNQIYNYREYFNEIKEYLEGKNGIIYEDEEDPEEFRRANEINNDDEEEEDAPRRRKKKKKKRKNSSRDSYDISESNNKSKDYVKIEMKNMDKYEEERLDKSDESDLDKNDYNKRNKKNKNNKKNEEEDEKDYSDSSSEERPKKKKGKRNQKKVEMKNLNDLRQPLNPDDEDDFK